MTGLKKAIDEFIKANVKYIYVDGSFTTEKKYPKDET